MYEEEVYSEKTERPAEAPAGAVRIDEPNESPPTSIESQRIQLESAQNTAGALPQGWAAKGYAKGISEELDRQNEEVRRKKYADNPKGYKNYLMYARFSQSAYLEGAMRYEAAQLQHAATVEADALAADIVSQTRRTVSEWGAVGQIEKWAAIEEAQRNKADVDASSERTAEEAAAIAGDGEDGDVARKGVESALAASKAETTKSYANSVSGAQSRWEYASDRMFVHVGENMKRLYGMVERNAVNAGASPLVAKARAEAAVRAASFGVMAGMIEDGNHEMFERWLGKLGSADTVEAEVDGDGRSTVVNAPMRRWCLGRNDLKKLSDTFLDSLARDARRRKLLAREESAKEMNEIQLLRAKGSLILSNPSYSSKDDDAVEAIIKYLMSRIPNASEKGGAACREAVEHLLSVRGSRERREERVATKVAKMRTEEEAVALVREIEAAIDTTRSVFLLSDDGSARESSADARHILKRVIVEAQDKGFLKGKSWNDRLAALDETTQKDFDEQRDAFASVRKALNLHILTEDEDRERAASGFKKRNGMRRIDAFDDLVQIDSKTGAYCTKNANATWRWVDSDGIGYDLTSGDVNALLGKAAEFQRLHKDAKTADLVDFMTETLREGARDAVVERYSDGMTGWIWDRLTGTRHMRARSAPLGYSADRVLSAMLNDGNTVRGFNAAISASSGMVVNSSDVAMIRKGIKADIDRQIKELEARKKAAKGASK